MKNMKNNEINKNKLSKKMDYDDSFDININGESIDENNIINGGNKEKKENFELNLNLDDIDKDEDEIENFNNIKSNQNKKGEELF